MGFIFRPHKGFIYEMLTLGFWNNDDLKRLKVYCDQSSNMVFDDTDTYNEAMSIADGILTDALCGIICSALPTLKPICIAFRSHQEIMEYDKELLGNYYSAYDSQDIITFFDMIKGKNDPMLRLRVKASRAYVKNFDGKNDIRIKNYIKKEYFKRLNEKILNSKDISKQ